jgi:hypothetical protein
MEQPEIRKFLTDKIKEGKTITVKWDCGGDEAFAYFFENGEAIDDMEISEDLELMIINQLNLPDAGEFVLEGEGRLFLEDDKLLIEYKSILKELEGEEMNEVQDEFSGKKILLQ